MLANLYYLNLYSSYFIEFNFIIIIEFNFIIIIAIAVFITSSTITINTIVIYQLIIQYCFAIIIIIIATTKIYRRYY